MLTRDERRALFFLGAVSLAGGALRLVRAPQPESAREAVAPYLAGGDLARQAALSLQAQAAARPLGPGEKVDVEHASAEELARLPRIGRRLALLIVTDRRDRGPFGSLTGLARVPGVSPGVLRALARYATFGGVSGAITYTGPEPLPAPRATPAGPAAGPKDGPGCEGLVDLNRAGREALLCLPGIGPVLADRILAERSEHGPYRDVTDLARVRGMGKGRIERLRPRVSVP